MNGGSPADGGTPESLLARWRDAGDAAALGALFDATAPDLFRIALSVAPDPASAEDALQETFLALMEAAARVDLSRPLVPFLVGILRHKVEKSRARARRVPDPARLPDPDLRVEDPVRAAERSEEGERVRRAILALPEAYRKAALLRWSHGLEPAEIAEVLEKPPGTVWSLLSRARGKLKRALTGVPVVLATGARPPRGLSEVRRVVAARAGTLAAATAGAGTALATGGVLMGRQAVAATALLLAAFAAAWFVASGEGGDGPGGKGVVASVRAPRPASSAPRVPGPAAVGTGESGPASSPGGGGAAGLPDFVPTSPGLHSGGVFGRVVDGDRFPAAGAKVSLRLGARLMGEAVADADGRFFLPPVPVEPWPAGVGRHFRFCLLATDARGRAVRRQCGETTTLDPGDLDPGATILLPRLFVGTLTLREAFPLEVVVTAGGVPAAGALVHAEDPIGMEGTEEVAADAEGRARLDSLPSGRWILHARCEGRGSGRATVDLPADDSVAIPLTLRSLEILAVDGTTGGPVEGLRFLVLRPRPDPGGERWTEGFPPLATPPTDSAGRARLEDAGEGPLRLLPLPPGEEEPAPDAHPEQVPPEASRVVVRLDRGTAVRWPAAFGDRDPPPEGSAVIVAFGDRSMDGVLLLRYGETRSARLEGGAVVVEGPVPAGVAGVAQAPDGSLARLGPPAADGVLPPVRFFAPRTLRVEVKDEDGLAFPDLVALLAPDGTSIAHPERVDEGGRVEFGGLPPGVIVVCALARTQWGGAEVARADMAAGDREVRVVVGREFPLVLRVRIGGKPGLPGEYEVRLRTPGPDCLGEAHFEYAPEVEEDAEAGEIRFPVRPHAPGAAVRIALRAGGGPWKEVEVRPAVPGHESVAAIDL